jgi:hypothetical protein
VIIEQMNTIRNSGFWNKRENNLKLSLFISLQLSSLKSCRKINTLNIIVKCFYLSAD